MVLKILKAFFLWITPLCCALAQPSAYLQKGDSAFAARQYRLALQHYQVVEKTGYGSPAMYLKMAYINEGLSQIAPGLRYLSLYQAMTGDPAAQQKIQALAEKNQLSGYELSDWEKLRELAGTHKTRISIFLCLFTLLLIGWLVLQKIKNQHTSWLPTALVTVSCFALAFNQYGNRPPQYGILNGSTNYLLRGPSAGAGLASTQKDGHRVKIVGRNDIWWAVEWNKQTVFVRESQLLTLTPVQ